MNANILSSFALTVLRAHVEQSGDSYNPAASELRDLTPSQVEDLEQNIPRTQMSTRV